MEDSISFSSSPPSRSDDEIETETDDDDSYSSLDESEESSVVGEGMIRHDDHNDNDDDITSIVGFGHYHTMEEEEESQHYYAHQVRQWVLQVPIGLGLCPWAGKSHARNNLRYITCPLQQPEQVMEMVYSEMERLVNSTTTSGGGDDGWKYSTTLLICPFVNEWKEDFEAFEQFVNNGCLIISTTRQDGELDEEFQNKRRSIQQSYYRDKRLYYQNKITLVPFHPNFLRWRGLPKGIRVGTAVQSHWGMVGRKSGTKAKATIVETENKVFGRQKVKIRFHQELEGRRLEQYVPIDWISVGDGIQEEEGPPLPDNTMHQAPYPTIHLISNQDLASLSIRDISRVKRKNAQRMMKLGWSGVQKQAAMGK